MTDSGFETTVAWNAYSATVGVSLSNDNQWHVGGDATGWIRKTGDNVPYAGNYAAGDGDGVGLSHGLVQFIPVGVAADHVTLSFQHLLWMGEDDTTMKYAVYGWSTGQTISLGAAGPGTGTAIIGPTTLTAPQFAGDADPSDDYTLESTNTAFAAGTYDYIGVWLQYELDGGSFFIDDVQLTITPEPTAITALLFGGLAIMRRRRR